MDFPYFWVSLGVVVLTGLWVAVDARINRVPTYGDKYDMNTGAFCWLLGCLILWIFVFPAYWIRKYSVLRRRVERAGEPPVEEQNLALKEELRRSSNTQSTKKGGEFNTSTIVGTIIGAAVGTSLTKLVPVTTLVLLGAGALAGFLVCLIPYFLAKARGQVGLGKIALAGGAIAGLAGGIIAGAPVALVFTIIALARGKLIPNQPLKPTPPASGGAA